MIINSIKSASPLLIDVSLLEHRRDRCLVPSAIMSILQELFPYHTLSTLTVGEHTTLEALKQFPLHPAVKYYLEGYQQKQYGDRKREEYFKRFKKISRASRYDHSHTTGGTTTLSSGIPSTLVKATTAESVTDTVGGDLTESGERRKFFDVSQGFKFDSSCLIPKHPSFISGGTNIALLIGLDDAPRIIQQHVISECKSRMRDTVVSKKYGPYRQFEDKYALTHTNGFFPFCCISIVGMDGLLSSSLASDIASFHKLSYLVHKDRFPRPVPIVSCSANVLHSSSMGMGKMASLDKKHPTTPYYPQLIDWYMDVQACNPDGKSGYVRQFLSQPVECFPEIMVFISDLCVNVMFAKLYTKKAIQEHGDVFDTIFGDEFKASRVPLTKMSSVAAAASTRRGPHATVNQMLVGCRANARRAGRSYVVPDDVIYIAPHVLGHLFAESFGIELQLAYTFVKDIVSELELPV
ncbi:hypothetical protein ADUPG1_009895 [Aduncisulcus paluster]|uniref:magnesium chelatase n=1 Tax=Aduncisulcus paluster TaxID=2918883 RepID=A0ABQ5KZC7_9EUKA|nr:hypothetical protein ADUPG1_009895 [Aduncisulcus paluster]